MDRAIIAVFGGDLIVTNYYAMRSRYVRKKRAKYIALLMRV